jgi:hypothetical protein
LWRTHCLDACLSCDRHVNYLQRVGADAGDRYVVQMRREHRFPCQPTTARVLLGASDEPVIATVGEVSRSGVKIETSHKLPVGETARVEIDWVTIQGRVRYCREGSSIGRFETGVEIDEIVERKRQI